MAQYRTKHVDDFEQIVFCEDTEAGLEAIIAIHDTTLGPALGGCRLWPYPNEREAFDDVMRLARGMTRKAAMAGLPLGGGKAVIIADPKTAARPALLAGFGRFVDRLGGRYITAEDVSTSTEDMEIVACETRHVSGRRTGSGDPSPHTAYGVFTGIRAAVRHCLGGDSLIGAKVAVQGLGHVGMNLCRLLHDAGADLFVTDIAAAPIARAAEKFGAHAVAPDAIYDVAADLFAPCALGGAISADTVRRLKVGIVAGSANNQLSEPSDGAALAGRGILYAPDYVINAGGLINVSWDVTNPDLPYDSNLMRARVERIGPTLTDIFNRAKAERRPTNEIADAVADARLSHAQAA